MGKMRKLLPIIICMLLVFIPAQSVSASEATSAMRYEYISFAEASLDTISDPTKYSCTVRCDDCIEKIVIYMFLERKINNTWSTYNGNSGSNTFYSNDADFSLNAYNVGSGTYRTKASIYVYTNTNGAYVEHTTAYSD